MNFETISNREVRRIPKGWKHPKAKDGRFEPVLARRYWEELAREVGAETLKTQPMPSVEGLPAERTEIAAYETTTEGTPISPAFPDTQEGKLALVNWCAEHESTFGDFKADAETWAGILFGDSVASIDGSDGRVRFA